MMDRPGHKVCKVQLGQTAQPVQLVRQSPGRKVCRASQVLMVQRDRRAFKVSPEPMARPVQLVRQLQAHKERLVQTAQPVQLVRQSPAHKVSKDCLVSMDQLDHKVFKGRLGQTELTVRPVQPVRP